MRLAQLLPIFLGFPLVLACSASRTDDHAPAAVDLNDASTDDTAMVADANGGDAEPEDTEPAFDLDSSPPCADLKCRRPICASGTTTTLMGRVMDPSGKLPLYNVAVYVPNAEVMPLPKGASCDRCGALVSGAPIAAALTDARGQFVLNNVPAGENIPLVIQVGKWRRQIVVPNVDACTENSAGTVRLPRKKSEGDMPKVAIATGGADAMECIFKRIGIDDSEFTGPTGSGSFHLYNGRGGSTVSGSQPATSLWATATKLKNYDMVVLSCEGSEYASDKDSSLTAMYDYANAGGKVFASHYHYYWFARGPSDFQSTATWTPDAASSDGVYNIDTSFPKGKSFADWLMNVGASTTKGQIALKDVRTDVSDVAPKRAQRWIYGSTPKYFTFNTPVGKPADSQCGRVVFTDLHVGATSKSGGTFPSGCATGDLTAQEKALVFLLFDLASCVVPDDSEPPPPTIN